MFMAHKGTLVNVDSQISPIDRKAYPAEFEAYLHKVQQLAAMVQQMPGSEHVAFKNVRSKLEEFTGVDIQAEGSVRLQHGFLLAAAAIARGALSAVTLASWRALLAQHNPPLVHLHCADPEFVTEVARALARGIGTMAVGDSQE